jgi:hypothetical protein
MNAGDTLTLLDELVQYAGMEETCDINEAAAMGKVGMHKNSKKRYLHSSLCCIRPILTSVDDIVHAAQVMAPFQYSMDEKQAGLFTPLLESKWQWQAAALPYQHSPTPPLLGP